MTPDLVGRKVKVGFALLEVVNERMEPHEGRDGAVTRAVLPYSNIYRVDFPDGGYGCYGADQLEPIEEERHD